MNGYDIAGKVGSLSLGSTDLWTTVDLQFYNPLEGEDDCVQFDIENLQSPEGIKELQSLFSTFCKENGFEMEQIPTDSFGIYSIRSAKTHEDLMELEAEEEGYSFRDE